MPNIHKDWKQAKEVLTVSEVIKQYEDGYLGARYDPEGMEKLQAEATHAQASSAAHAFGFADSGKGKLSIPFTLVQQQYPNAWPGPAQARGSCVLHNQRNVLLGTMCAEVASGKPDEVSGKMEGYPTVSPLAERNGVLAIEPGYWLRGHKGDGYSCPSAMRDSIRTIGAVLRKNYPELDINIEELDSRLAGKYYKKSQIPASLLKGFGGNLIRDSTNADEWEEVRDLVYQNFILSTCGSEGWSNKRDANGYSARKGSWAHAMALIAVDDRPVVHKHYGEGLVLILNSWGVWNNGPRDIIESARLVPAGLKKAWIAARIINKKTGNIMIPKGSFWAKWSDVRRRTMIAAASLAGFGRERIDWSLNVR
jgi:hypothetical protein